jgi:hypothetical protein
MHYFKSVDSGWPKAEDWKTLSILFIKSVGSVLGHLWAFVQSRGLS